VQTHDHTKASLNKSPSIASLPSPFSLHFLCRLQVLLACVFACLLLCLFTFVSRLVRSAVSHAGAADRESSPFPFSTTKAFSLSRPFRSHPRKAHESLICRERRGQSFNNSCLAFAFTLKVSWVLFPAGTVRGQDLNTLTGPPFVKPAFCCFPLAFAVVMESDHFAISPFPRSRS
jgi:hypothetical protein